MDKLFEVGIVRFIVVLWEEGNYLGFLILNGSCCGGGVFGWFSGGCEV